MVILTAPVIFQNGARLAAMALRARMPSISIFTAFAEAGGLIAYGPDFPSIFRQAAGYVERILKGARSADLPIERPAKFELVVNLKTAKAIGVAIPNTILLRTDRVIQ
jgi:putative ABC transport system substrate-binding protein